MRIPSILFNFFRRILSIPIKLYRDTFDLERKPLNTINAYSNLERSTNIQRGYKMGVYDEFYITRCRDPDCNELFKSRSHRLNHERKEHGEIYKGERGFTVFFPNKRERDREFERLSELLSNSRRTEITIMKESIEKEREAIIMKKAQEQAALRAQEPPKEEPPIQQTQEIIYEPKTKPPEVKQPKTVEELIIEKKVENEKTAVNQVFKPTENSLKKENQSFWDEINAYFEGDEL